MSPPVDVCLIGAGRAARVHASSLVHHVPKGRLVAIVDPDAEALRKASTEFGIEDVFSGLEQAIDEVPFEAVVIATPTHTHSHLAEVAAQAKKHIFMEKPMALTMEECDVIQEAVTRSGVLLQTGFMRRFDPDFEEASARIVAGEIGQPMMIKSLTHGPGLPPVWARDVEKSNGNLAEVNSHDWDTVRWLMSSNYERVYVEIANFKGKARGIESDRFYDTALVSLRFENGGVGSISGICPCDYGYDARVEVIGETGIMQIGELKGKAVVVCVDREKGVVTPVFRSWPERFHVAYIKEMEHFIDCIGKNALPRAGVEEGRWAVAGVLAGTRSFLEKRPVYLSEVMDRKRGVA